MDAGIVYSPYMPILATPRQMVAIFWARARSAKGKTKKRYMTALFAAKARIPKKIMSKKPEPKYDSSVMRPYKDSNINKNFYRRIEVDV